MLIAVLVSMTSGFCSHPHHIVLGDLLFFVICLCNLCICMYCVVAVLYLAVSEMVNMYIRVQHVCTYMCLYTSRNKCYNYVLMCTHDDDAIHMFEEIMMPP